MKKIEKVGVIESVGQVKLLVVRGLRKRKEVIKWLIKLLRKNTVCLQCLWHF